MKQKIVKHTLGLACLLAALLFTFRTSYAHSSAPSSVPFNFSVQTICCYPAGTGPTSNNCDPNGGACSDGLCPEGTTERPYGLCL